MRRMITIWLLLSGGLVSAQEYTYPRDTSYTIHSAYLKLKKYYPEVTEVKPMESMPGTGEERDIPYKDTGRDLTLDVFFPKTGNRDLYPGILLIYGGGWNSGEKANQVPLAQQLAAHGYVAVVAEYRLSPEAVYPAAVNDLEDALRWMRKYGETFGMDTGRIAVSGCSAGAQLATLLGTTGKGKTRVQAIVNIDGIVSFIHPEAEEGTYAAKWLGGSREERPDLWKKASPLEYAGKDTPPVLFINSSQPRFHAGRDDLTSILDAAGTYSEVHTLDNSPHSFWHVHPWFDETVSLMTGFLDKVLKANSMHQDLK